MIDVDKLQSLRPYEVSRQAFLLMSTLQDHDAEEFLAGVAYLLVNLCEAFPEVSPPTLLSSAERWVRDSSELQVSSGSHKVAMKEFIKRELRKGE